MIPHFVGVQGLVSHQGYNHLSLHAPESLKQAIFDKLSISIQILQYTIC